jgi:hypothetical protein
MCVYTMIGASETSFSLYTGYNLKKMVICVCKELQQMFGQIFVHL